MQSEVAIVQFAQRQSRRSTNMPMNAKSLDILSFRSFVLSKGGTFLRHPVFILFSEMLIEITQSTGIVLDPCYTLKAARGMLLEMAKNPSRFKGSRVLFLHTGRPFVVVLSLFLSCVCKIFLCLHCEDDSLCKSRNTSFLEDRHHPEK